MTSSSSISVIPIEFSWKPNKSGFASKLKPFSHLIKIKSCSKSQLPILVKRNGKRYRYVYDGSRLELVGGDGGNGNEDGFAKVKGVITDLLIPKQVSENYIEYVKWKLLHRVFSSALQVLATQAMFRAIGVGYAHSLPSAAALNWVLKDGLGRLSRCIYTACVGSAFDTNLKTAVHQSFALADNLGEVSAKAQIQTVCFDNLGLLLAVSLNVICRNNQRMQVGLPYVVYPIFSAIDLCGIYRSLKHVHLQTLTKGRLEIILNTWIESGYVPLPAEVSKLEGINLFEDTLTGGKKGMWPIRIGCLEPNRQVPLLSMLTMTSVSMEDNYFICLETRSGLRKSQHKGILLALREGTEMKDIMMGLLQACYIRNAILSSVETWDNIFEASDISHSTSRKWFALLQNSKYCAHTDLHLLQEQIINANWAAKNVLLNSKEQARYDFVGDNI